MRFDDLHWAEQEERDFDAETASDIVRYRSELGLPVDDAIVAHFLTEFKAERHEGGMWLTEAEEEEHDRVSALVDAVREAAEPYVAEHRADFAGWWIGYGRGECHVGFARNVESHRQALEGLVPRRDILHVHAAEFTEAELQAVSERVSDEADELAAEGVTWMGTSVGGKTNRVRVDVAATDAATASAILARRFGRAVTCNWIGPEDTTVGEAAWQLWTLDESGHRLTVHFTTASEYKLERAEYTEDENEVRVTVFVRCPNVVKAIAAHFQATVELSAPLGDRRVVDGVTGHERQRRVPRDVLERSWELIREYGAEHPEEFGGSWAEHPGCHAAFTGHVDTHRRALLALLPEPRALVVHQVERTEADLTALKERIAQERGYLRDRGIRFDEAYIWIDDNAVFLEIEAEDEDAARRFLAARYGPALEVMWVMP